MSEWLDFFVMLLTDHLLHWALAFVLGYLVFSSILTILYVQLSVWANLTQSKVSTVAVCFILGISILGMLSVVVLSHVALDGLLSWWQAPLGPPLELDLSKPNF